MAACKDVESGLLATEAGEEPEYRKVKNWLRKCWVWGREDIDDILEVSALKRKKRSACANCILTFDYDIDAASLYFVMIVFVILFVILFIHFFI